MRDHFVLFRHHDGEHGARRSKCTYAPVISLTGVLASPCSTHAPRSLIPSCKYADCPGTGAEDAGKAAACAGCPNQAACASAPKEDPDQVLIDERISKFKHIILVLSGKGGVGKSTFSAQLAFAMAAKGLDVGLLDIDICGPSTPQPHQFITEICLRISCVLHSTCPVLRVLPSVTICSPSGMPKMLGLEAQEVHQSSYGWSPVYVQDNLGVMSIGFLLPDPDDAVIWRGPRKNGIIKQFLKDTYWGDDEMDVLIVDAPPGTSDEHISIVKLLEGSRPGVEAAQMSSESSQLPAPAVPTQI